MVCFFGGEPLQDLFHIVDEAHVQHPVSLVQNKDLQVLQPDEPLLVQIHQTARRGHQNIHAAAQGLHLGILAHAAEDDGVAQGQVCPIGGEALADLDGQLPGGREDQGAEPVVRRPGLAQPLEDGGGKGTGLAGAGLGAAQYVPPRQGRGNGLLLDGRGAS